MFEVVLMVSDGIEMDSTGGGCLDYVDAIVEFVTEGVADFTDLALDLEMEGIDLMSCAEA